MVRSSGCSSVGKWSASPCTPISPWVQRLAPPGVRPSTISLLIFNAAGMPFHPEPHLNSRTSLRHIDSAPAQQHGLAYPCIGYIKDSRNPWLPPSAAEDD